MDMQNEGQTTQSSNPTPNASKGADSREIIDELTHLGQKFVEIVEVAWNSEERKKLERELRSGLVSVATSLEDGVKRVGNSKEAKDAMNAAEDVADKVLKSKISAELSDALAVGLRTLNAQMDKLATEMKQKSSSVASQAADAVNTVVSESQDIPIVQEAMKAAEDVAGDAKKAASEAKKAAEGTFSETQS